MPAGTTSPISSPIQVQRLIGAEPIREGIEGEVCIENDNSSAGVRQNDLRYLLNQQQEKTLSIQKLKRDIQKLEVELQEINREINNLRKELKTPISPERDLIIDELNQADVLAESYVNQVLKQFPDIKKRIELSERKIFETEIEGWLKQISNVLLTNNLNFLSYSNPDLKLPSFQLGKPSKVYKQVYLVLFDTLTKDLCRNIKSTEVKNDVFYCVERLKNDVLRFLD